MATDTLTAGPSLFDRPVVVPPNYASTATKLGWPDGFVERMLQLRIPTYDIEHWLDHHKDWQYLSKFLDAKERIMSGTIKVREAFWSDAEAVAEMYANSPEDVGDFEVTVERSPYPFAQFRLQEHANIQIVEDRGVVLAAAAHSARNTLIEGRELSCHIASAWRVRKECRGQGMTTLMRVFGGPACAWFGLINYWYVRSGNFGAVDWIKSLRPDIAEAAEKQGGDLPGLQVGVHHFRARPFDGDIRGIRKATHDDAARIVPLINRTHKGQDFFRPYTAGFLIERIGDCGWGPKPDFIELIYNWDDYYVLEQDGKIVACAGLWDRGKHIREVWRNKSTGDTTTIDAAALMDFGYARGREDAMARLIGYLIGVTNDLGRQELLAPLEQLPKLAELMSPYEPAIEPRTLAYDGWDEGSIQVSVTVRRPYTDLAYW
jgi:hypothetical protein